MKIHTKPAAEVALVDLDGVQKMIVMKDATVPADLDPAATAALTVTAALILNLDEVLTRP